MSVSYPPDRPVAVDGSLSGQRHGPGREAPRKLAPLLLLMALGVGAESCIVPQQIQEYQTPPTPTLPSPVFDIASADVLIGNNLGQSAYVVCLDDTTVQNAQFQIPLEDAGGTALDVRWFVNYDFQNQTSWEIQKEESHSPLTKGGGNYGNVTATASALGLRLTYGIFSVEVVASDEFDPQAYPQNRTPAAGHYAASYKWIVNYVRGTSACGEP